MLQYEESGWVGGCSSILMCKPMGIIIYNALKLFRPRHFCWILTSPECTIGLECIFYSPNNLFPKGSFCTLGARYIIIIIVIIIIVMIIIIIIVIKITIIIKIKIIVITLILILLLIIIVIYRIYSRNSRSVIFGEK